MMVSSSVFSLVSDARRIAHREQHEGELAALRQGDTEAARRSRLQPLPASEHVEDRRLDDDQPGHQRQDDDRLIE